MLKQLPVAQVVSGLTERNLVTSLRAVSTRKLQGFLDTNSTCWLHFCQSVIIAWQQEKAPCINPQLPGLEIAFDMMVHLASAENYYPIDGGIILLGFFTAVVPIRRHQDSNTIQWHFEYVANDDTIYLSKLESIQGRW